MIKSFSRDEKMALISIIKFIAVSDRRLTENELEKINRIAEEKGFDDFSIIFNDVDREIKTLDDIRNLIKKVKSSEHKNDIVKYALEVAVADAEINEEEAEILSILSDEWDIDIS